MNISPAVRFRLRNLQHQRLYNAAELVAAGIPPELTEFILSKVRSFTIDGVRHAKGAVLVAWARSLAGMAVKPRQEPQEPVSRVAVPPANLIDLRSLQPAWEYTAAALATMTGRPQKWLTNMFRELPTVTRAGERYAKGADVAAWAERAFRRQQERKYLPSRRRIFEECRKFQRGWSEAERQERIRHLPFHARLAQEGGAA